MDRLVAGVVAVLLVLGGLLLLGGSELVGVELDGVGVQGGVHASLVTAEVVGLRQCHVLAVRTLMGVLSKSRIMYHP